MKRIPRIVKAKEDKSKRKRSPSSEGDNDRERKQSMKEKHKAEAAELVLDISEKVTSLRQLKKKHRRDKEKAKKQLIRKKQAVWALQGKVESFEDFIKKDMRTEEFYSQMPVIPTPDGSESDCDSTSGSSSASSRSSNGDLYERTKEELEDANRVIEKAIKEKKRAAAEKKELENKLADEQRKRKEDKQKKLAVLVKEKETKSKLDIEIQAKQQLITEMERLKRDKAESEQEAKRVKEELENRNRAKRMREERNKREVEEREAKKRRPAKNTTDEINLADSVRKTLKNMKTWRDEELYLETNEDRELVEAAETYCGVALPKRNHKYVVTQANLESVAGTRYRPTPEQLQEMSPEERARAEAIRDYCRDWDCAIYIANNSYNIYRDPSPESRQRSHTARAEEFSRRQADQRLSVSSSTGYTTNSEDRPSPRLSRIQQLPATTPSPVQALPKHGSDNARKEAPINQEGDEKKTSGQKVPPLKISGKKISKPDEPENDAKDNHHHHHQEKLNKPWKKQYSIGISALDPESCF